MRKGQNPAKFINAVVKPQRITVAVLNYIPFLSGFYAETLEVLKACLDSLRTKAGLPFDLMVFDNGSCVEARDYLISEKEAGRIQYLLLSEKNVGKGGAWNIIFPGVPGEILAYTDSDVLFSAGWLRRSVEILEGFPNVGMVTARPFRTPPDLFSRTIEWARSEKQATISEEQFIPWERFLEFNLSLGQTEAENRKVYAETRDVVIRYGGQTALAGASHWQFTAYKACLQQFVPFEMDKPMGQVRQLDRRVNDAGLLRLMVPEPLAMNMSNTMGYGRGELKKAPAAGRTHPLKRLLELGLVKKVLLAIYNRIFKWYYS